MSLDECQYSSIPPTVYLTPFRSDLLCTMIQAVMENNLCQQLIRYMSFVCAWRHNIQCQDVECVLSISQRRNRAYSTFYLLMAKCTTVLCKKIVNPYCSNIAFQDPACAFKLNYLANNSSFTRMYVFHCAYVLFGCPITHLFKYMVYSFLLI